ncbi:hypothetical protein [Hyalangium rubrum]|uniref:Uncharacterized protein n=1 Tax=Hyalangium rubrum TaxID=3103134 RepID=A0ABU5H0T2_9BACT|nr:hypothetical protein [Hyalangium sp. s54d21]MDY7227060.1 hypothetical protein [Hyalangium sp. s54d21]
MPHKVGQYFSVRDMGIEKAKAGSAQAFRCEGWMGPLLVSGEIKDAGRAPFRRTHGQGWRVAVALRGAGHR